MQKLTRSDLYSLERYAEVRSEFRVRVMQHKRVRRVAIGEHAALYFEDRLTMQYQIQEVLRVERIFEAAGIEEELEAYNPLIPDGGNWKATFMIEYSDENERDEALKRLINVEDHVWMRVQGHDKIYAVADEDLERETAEKTSAVHFMRFELAPEMIAAVKGGAALAAGIDLPGFEQQLDPLPGETTRALLADLD
ncbi:hypothetical protein BI364_11970 [Acidihalobacter yilgarnensis]|uniref:DUF3501 domain-containing protein n=1 Tax=Acidihalobacter yilgarnensis TaxID=2819280 RepID=A0A1D8IQ59_9GAMM|nr:DUF3501 family protein [Acidihalobacter yilgarnensis]AOU98577.1 hypothetical protein BI364_11970 [Acidihalobacter yilgarnensis]